MKTAAVNLNFQLKLTDDELWMHFDYKIWKQKFNVLFLLYKPCNWCNSWMQTCTCECDQFNWTWEKEKIKYFLQAGFNNFTVNIFLNFYGNAKCKNGHLIKKGSNFGQNNEFVI